MNESELLDEDAVLKLLYKHFGTRTRHPFTHDQGSLEITRVSGPMLAFVAEVAEIARSPLPQPTARVSDEAARALYEFVGALGVHGASPLPWDQRSSEHQDKWRAALEAALPRLSPKPQDAELGRRVDVAALTRPIAHIDLRSPEEAFDIMCDRIKSALSLPGGTE